MTKLSFNQSRDDSIALRRKNATFTIMKILDQQKDKKNQEGAII